jgi:integrase
MLVGHFSKAGMGLFWLAPKFIKMFWKPGLDRKRVKPSTIDGYDSVLDRHLLPQLGDLRIADVAPLHVEEIVQKKTSEGFSAKTIRNMVMVLRGIFTLAVEQDVIPRSPVRKSHMPESEKKEKRIWTPDEVRKIIDAAPAAYKALFALVALTGIRLGELLALQWKHVDSEAGSLRITQSIWRGQIVAPKTTGSVRMIWMGPVLTDILKAHEQASQHRDREDFIFCKPDGSPLHPDVLRKDVLYPILDRLGIQRFPRESGFHAFRHSAGSIVNNETGNLKLAQVLLGHSNLSTTADVYTHTLTEAERGASEALEKAIFGTLFPVVPKTGTGNRFSVN